MTDMSPATETKYEVLLERLGRLDSVLVAYSGGTDSAFLAHSAYKALGIRMRAVLADSASLARSHFRDAVNFARENGIPLDIIRTHELEIQDYVRNDASRCFHCKHELFDEMERKRAQLGFVHLAFGMNADDHQEYRPGHAAAEEFRVIAPLAEAGLTKTEIREIAQHEGLRIWDKPASACLSSRIEYGRPVTIEALARVEAGEEILRELGFQQFRVRHHGELVRIEISTDEMPLALSAGMVKRFTQRFKTLGFLYVTLDCEGYRSGSMNAVLPVGAIQPASVSQHRKAE